MTVIPNKHSPQISLRLVLIVPFVVIVLVAVASVGYIAFTNGQRAVNDVAQRLRGEVSARIESHLHGFLEIPHQVNQITLAALQHGWLEPQDAQRLQDYFLAQVKAHRTLTSVYFGNVAGGIVGSGREGAAESLYVYLTENLTANTFNKYAVTDGGEVGELLTSLPNFDARTRPWYRGGIQHGTPTWSDIYILFTGQDLAISASSPVYDGRYLLGVVAVDIFLAQIEDFLATLDISQAGQSFIMERSGLLVAASTSEKPFITNSDGGLERLDVRHSQSPMVRAAAGVLRGRFGENYGVTDAAQLDFELAGERYFLNVSPVQDEYGIDWLSVVVIPESDFMAGIAATNRSTLLITLLALVVASLAGILLAQRIADRMAALNASIHAFTTGAGAGPAVDSSRISEIDELITSFTDMKQQLRQRLADLHAEVGTRQRAEEALRENRQFLSDLVELSGALIFVKDRAGCYELINRKWEETTGLSRDKVIGQTDLTLFPGSIGEQFRTNDLTVIESGSVIEVEEVLEDARDKRYFISIKFPLRDETGTVKGICGVTTEITARKRAEEALRESEALYRLISENIADVIWKMDPVTGQFTYVSPSVQKLRGYTPEQVMAQPVSGSLTPDSLRRVGELLAIRLPQIQAQAAGTQSYTDEVDQLHRDGSIVHTEVTTTYWRNDRGEIEIFGVTRDITERKRTEEILRDAHRRLESIIEGTHVGTWEWNVQTGETVFNEMWAHIIGYTLDELAPVSIKTWEAFAHPDDLKQSALLLERHFARELPDYDCESRMRHKDGHWVWIHDRGRVITRTDDGRPLMMFGTHTDITERKQAEAALREWNVTLEQRVADRTHELAAANARLMELDQLKDQFISRISHELRTPLTSIKIYLEMLDTVKPEKRAKYMQVLAEQTSRLQTLIEDLLEVTQQRVNVAGLHIVPTDLNHLAASLVAAVAPRAAKRGLTLTHTLMSDLPLVAADAIVLTQALSNLATNALNYTPTGGSIDFSTASVIESGETWITFTLRDTGPGIAPDEQPHIFDRFYRGRAAADYKTPGAGVGLSLSRDILASLDGRLTVQSDGVSGHGAAFTAWLKPA